MINQKVSIIKNFSLRKIIIFAIAAITLGAFFYFISVASIAIAGKPDKPGAGNPPPSTRTYDMGFSSWPPNFDAGSIASWQRFFPKHADIKLLHFDSGIPWPEAYSGAAFSSHLQGDWAFKRDELAPGIKTLLAITPLDFERSSLALYWGEAGDGQPLPAPWDQLALNDPMVKEAYVNYLERAIAYFNPAYVLTGIEANLLLSNDESQWPAYVELQQYVYDSLKAAHPDLPIAVSFAYDHFIGEFGADTLRQQAGLQEISPAIDIVGISLYPYDLVLNAASAAEIKSTLIGNLQPMWDLQKKVAISEMGVPDRSITVGTTTFDFSSQDQVNFITAVLEMVEERDLSFVINYVAIDYDKMLTFFAPELQEILKIWAWTGLADSRFRGKPALGVWDSYLAH
ncbi:MAG: hypothetical protein Q8Q23_01030 [bacterium]|nr:hypothetical protein [bacterium]